MSITACVLVTCCADWTRLVAPRVMATLIGCSKMPPIGPLAECGVLREVQYGWDQDSRGEPLMREGVRRLDLPPAVYVPKGSAGESRHGLPFTRIELIS